MKQITGAALGVQAFVGHMPDMYRVDPLRNGDGVMIPSQKPLGGCWTSPWDAKRRTSAWMEDLARRAAVHRLRRGGLDCWLLRPRPETRLLVIDGLADLERLLSRYGRRVSMTGTVRDATVMRWFADEVHRARTPGKSGKQSKQNTVWLVPGYEAIAADGWAGIHLTASGSKTVHLTMPNLYTWDTEGVFWFCSASAGGWPFGGDPEHVGNLTECIIEGMLRDGTARLAGDDQRLVSGVKR